MTRRCSTIALLAACGLVVSLLPLTASAAPPDPASAAPPDPASAAPPDPEGFTATPLAPAAPPEETAKSPSGRLAESDPGLLERGDAEPVAVMVKYDYDAVAAYAGGIGGLAATSPSVTGRDLAANRRAVQRYRAHIDARAAEITAAVEDTVDAQVTGTFQTAYGGAAMVLPARQARDLLAVPGVAAVQLDRLEQPQTDASPAFIGADTAWRSLGGSRTAGEGVVVGVLDTGIWPEHPSLADPGIEAPAGSWGCEFGDGSDPALGEPFACTDKLIGAYAFTDTYQAVVGALDGEYCAADGTCSARDSDGHGTHTATTAAGAPVDSAPLLGVDRGPVSGIAPGAHVIAYRVCLAEGCFQSDSVAAVQQAITDGVDVVNFSISGGTSAYTDPVELAFLDAYAAGILVNASAGNDGPGAGTANHAGPWTNTVGASTSDRHFLTSLRLAAPDGSTWTATGATVTDGVDTPTELVDAGDCNEPLPAGSVEGKIAACQRGTIARVVKSFNARAGGAVGMILYNPVPQGLNTDNHVIPSVHVDQPDSDDLLDFLAAHDGVTATWEPGTATEVRGDVMASFSSRGPLGDFVKPDVTAPGVQILAGHTPTPVLPEGGLPGQLFQAIAGTSMSSPHAAGVSALVKAAHPDWTPGQLKSALMTSSVQDVLKEDGASLAEVFDMGAGSIRADRALRPTLTLDETAGAYLAGAADPLHRIDLNLPSINADPMPGVVETTRSVTNVSGRVQVIRPAVQAPDGVTITVSPPVLALRSGQTRDLTVTIKAVGVSQGWHFGRITLDPRRAGFQDATIPVALNATEGSLGLDHTCEPTAVQRNQQTDCEVTVTNSSPQEAHTTLTLKAPRPVTVSGVSAPATATDDGFTWTGTLAPALPPTVDAVRAGATPPGGYLPLRLLGVPPVPGMGDETIVNVTTPEFRYGGEAYTRLAVDSNGYLVVGGGTAQDNDCCNPQTFPDPTRPNNVLAPFWTDLDPGAGGTVRVGTATDGVDTWIVVDWEEVPAFGTTLANSFQVWIETGAEEDVSYAYGPVGGPSSDGLSVGAENRDGTSGAMWTGPQPVEGAQLVVETSPPRPGGSVTVTYDAASRRAGTYDLVAAATASTVRGTTTEAVRLTVTR